MASVDVRKNTKQQAHQKAVHFDDYLRKNRNHSNPDIDKSKTHLNYWIDCSGYREAMRKIDERVDAVDEVQPPKRVRSDRVTMLSINIPCPKEIELQGKSDEFFAKAYEVIQQKLGVENVAGATVHKDEIHEYLDHGVRKESLQHMDIFAVPYTPEKGINAKALCTRSFFRDLSEEVHQMCLREFEFEFKTGKESRQLSVEALKIASAKEELEYIKQQKATEQLEFENQVELNCEILDSLKATAAEYLAKGEKLEKKLEDLAKSLKTNVIQVDGQPLELDKVIYFLEKAKPANQKEVYDFLKQMEVRGTELMWLDLEEAQMAARQFQPEIKEPEAGTGLDSWDDWDPTDSR